MVEKYDIKANIFGGGFTGQSQALRLAIARALVKINAEDKPALRKEGFMTRDSRVVERTRPSKSTQEIPVQQTLIRLNRSDDDGPPEASRIGHDELRRDV